MAGKPKQPSPAMGDRLERVLKHLEDAAGPWVEKVHEEAQTNALSGTDAWYQASYNVFASNPRPTSPTDFVKTVAFALSWVASIPEGNPSVAFKAISEAADKVRAAEQNVGNEASVRQDARRRAVQAVQTGLSLQRKDSVVIASKVLHFLDPDLAPMIDINVSLGWKKLEKEFGPLMEYTISEHPFSHQYLAFWEFAFGARYHFRDRTPALTYRRLDELLFQLGRH